MPKALGNTIFVTRLQAVARPEESGKVKEYDTDRENVPMIQFTQSQTSWITKAPNIQHARRGMRLAPLTIQNNPKKVKHADGKRYKPCRGWSSGMVLHSYSPILFYFFHCPGQWPGPARDTETSGLL
jgi:hypothetical protein